MPWPYHFISLSDTQISDRRALLDLYASYAQLSALAPIAAFQLFFLWSWVRRRWSRRANVWDAVPSSPYLKSETSAARGGLQARWGRTRWWLAGDVVEGYGTRAQWIAAGAWTAWLLLLAVRRTGDDYLHLTKRFGMVAVSQLPFHYLLAFKPASSPLTFAFRASHEQLNPYHRMLGRIIIFLLVLHGTFYLNYFIRSSILFKRLQDLDVILGLTSLTLLATLGTMSLGYIRNLNYRVFYRVHIVIATVLLPILYFHVSYLRVYILETAGLAILHYILRMWNTDHLLSSLTFVPGTNLIAVTVTLPKSYLQSSSKAFYPGQHVYLTLPSWSHPSALYTRGRTNPFTVANLPSTSSPSLLLVARALTGTTSTLAQLASPSRGTIRLGIEGPYGSSRRFPYPLNTYDRVLLVAGGIGATFAVPIYWDLVFQSPDARHRVHFVWAVRHLAETRWAFPIKRADANVVDKAGAVEVFVTGEGRRSHLGETWDGIELVGERERLSRDGQPGADAPPEGLEVRLGRPHLRTVVDEIFAQSMTERVAVLFCGPPAMGKALRHEVGRWVGRGRDVWWHAEEFGW